MRNIHKLSLIGFAVALVISSTLSILMSTKTYAADCDTDFYSSNDIIFYNPCEDGGGTSCTAGLGTLDAPAPNALSGESNAEKVWNYFIVRGLTPVAAAGAMGNIEQESSFNPLVQEGGSGIGFGLIQWSFERRTKLEAAAAAQGVSFVPGANSDAALLFELNWLWDGEYGKQQWQPQVNAETKVEGDPSKSFSEDNTGNGSAMVFHALVERSGDNASGKQERIDSAKTFLERFGNNGSASGNCSVGQGGLTLEQAQKLMEYYKNDPEAMALVFNAGCSGTSLRESALANCVAFSEYFTKKFTAYKGVSIAGKKVVGEMASVNAGGKTGKDPQPFAIFSRDSTEDTVNGHTGVVLGVHDGKVVLGEAACGHGYAGIRAYEMTVEEMKNDPRNFTFFYLGDKMDTSKLNTAVGG